MKFIVDCEVDSETILPRRQEMRTKGRTFFFEVDRHGRWNRLRVVADVPDPARFKWGTEPVPQPRRPNEAPLKVNAVVDQDLLDSITRDIQSLESTLSVFFRLRSVNWRHATWSVGFEEGDHRDAGLGHLGDFQLDRAKPKPAKATEEQFIDCVCLGLASHSLMVIESFWREGENDWEAGKFINAFFNYYFILEGLYGGGKTKNRGVEDELRGSSELRQSLAAYMADDHPVRHLEQLAGLLQPLNEVPGPDALIDLLVSIRGRLHHFQNNPNRPQGSPLAHDEYEGVAMLARYLAVKGLVSAAFKIKSFGHKSLRP